MKIAVLGYGTVGSGVVEVLDVNQKLIASRAKEEIEVNSRHKNTIDTHPNLIVNCICEDGYIDGVESPDKTFYVAFRFHPESLYKVNKDHNKIFEEFIRKCRE